MNPISVAVKGKGLKKLSQRAITVTRRYGVTASKIGGALDLFSRLLQIHDCNATLPITAVVLKRNGSLIRRLARLGIEFAIHGHTHIDYSQLSSEEQIAYINQAVAIFEENDISVKGFRGPYLRWNQGTVEALRHSHLLYDSSQALAWDILDNENNEAYHRALQFYGAQSASQYPSLPWLDDGLVRIPYSLPDDESLVERLQLSKMSQMTELWLDILHHSHQLGELFTMGLHPERIDFCGEALEATLIRARTLEPRIWIARLDEIATWWRERFQTTVTIENHSGDFRFTVAGPEGVTILCRSVAVSALTEPWDNRYHRIFEHTFTTNTTVCPIIGFSPRCPSTLISFLQQQGYLFEISEERGRYSVYLDRPVFRHEDQRDLLSQIESSDDPLVRLGRWPNGACSALSITGDIDALTMWDYAMRLLRL